jgi:ribosomal protein S12 methylthiotransferase
LLDFVKECRFERLGAFTYSFEHDTPSARLPGHVSESEKERRRDAIMTAQQAIAFEFNQSLVGRTLDVLIDAPDAAPRTWVGRTYADAPDVDGVVLIRSASIRAGDLVRCRIDEARGYDLVARPVRGEPARRRARGGRAPHPAGSLPILPGT